MRKVKVIKPLPAAEENQYAALCVGSSDILGKTGYLLKEEPSPKAKAQGKVVVRFISTDVGYDYDPEHQFLKVFLYPDMLQFL